MWGRLRYPRFLQAFGFFAKPLDVPKSFFGYANGLEAAQMRCAAWFELPPFFAAREGRASGKTASAGR